MGQKITSYQVEDHSIISSDGESELFIRHFFKGKPKFHFLIVHGAVEHSGRHQDLVKFLLKNYQEVAITVFDNIGHGRSGGTRAYVDSFSHYLDDFVKVSEFCFSKNLSDTKTFILAHSLGGLIVLSKLLSPDQKYSYLIDGVILSSPCIQPKTILPSLSIPLLQKLNFLTPKLHLPMIYSGKDLTRDPERANDFDTDSLIPKFISVRMAKEILDASDKLLGMSYYLNIPTLFLIAGEDRIVDPLVTLLFARGVDKSLSKIIEYPYHHHELWNEIDRQDIFKTMKSWIDQRTREKNYAT